jgi:hydrogenase expression/formation protein HypE
MSQILLEHGGGGEKSGKLIHEIFLSSFSNSILERLEDASPFTGSGKMAMSTDSFTVKPLFFNGGDIGKLAVCGTCNDIAMMGARPKYLSCGFIIEEGFSIDDLKRITHPMKVELEKNRAQIITGDTKVVPRGTADGIFINTTGVGEIVIEGISAGSISEGDAIIISGSVGEHGAHIFVNRKGINIKSGLKSDCASLWPLVELLGENSIRIKALRDATRGGVSAVLNEWAGQSEVCLRIMENKIPVIPEVKGVCEILGFEPYFLACEGTFVMAVEMSEAEKAVEVIKKHELGKNAAVIGKADREYTGKVILETAIGTKRILDTPAGVLLPRIC